MTFHDQSGVGPAVLVSAVPYLVYFLVELLENAHFDHYLPRNIFNVIPKIGVR